MYTIEFDNECAIAMAFGYASDIEMHKDVTNIAAYAADAWSTKVVGLSIENLIDIGNAYGSFSIGEIDQGIHLLLPVTNSEGEPENAIFTDLFEDYFHHLPHFENWIPAYNEAYMGALMKWLKEVHGIEYGNTDFVAQYEKFAR